MRLSTERLARGSARRPWLTLGLWLVAIAVAGWLSSQYLDDALTTDASFTNDPEAKRATELAEARFGEEGVTEVFILSSENAKVTDPAFEEAVRSLQAGAADEGAEAVTFYDTEDPSMVSDDGHTTLMPVVFEDRRNLADHLPAIDALVEEGNDSGAITATSFGAITSEDDFSTIAEEDLRRGESFGILVALVVLVLVFGALVAGVIPIVMGVASIAIAIGLVALVGRAVDFSFFVTNMITMMGLAVGIDYSLFIVSRYREERFKGLEKIDAIVASGATASRAVFFSGMTVVLALLGMLIIPTTIFRSLGAGAIFVVVVAMLASLTLLPALLGLLGDRVNSIRVFRRKGDLGSETSHRFWNGITRRVMARPVISLVLGAGILIAASLSYFHINTGFAGVSTLPEDTRSRRGFEILSQEFSGGMNSPVEIVVDGDVNSPEVQGAIEDLQAELAGDDLFGPSQVQLDEAGKTAIVSAPVNADPFGQVATSSIDRVRDDYVANSFEGVDAEVLVGGDTAFNKDFFDLTDTYTPIVFVFVLGLSFLLLMVVFRSIVVPLKAIVMNLLSVGAAYGLIVLVFQEGFGAGVLGFQQVEAIEAWLPLFLFSVLFGLSMDYHVFLLSRIKERFDHTRDNTESVAYGLRTTGGLITGAAAIMVAVFSGFAAGELVMLQQMGFGLAVAVLIDATLVRSVLVPASMKLLGDRNWYLPRWLQWLPSFSVEGPQRAPDPIEPIVLPEPERVG
ncbi:MAG: MMPL family transporter [Actinomycetota bacterium]|nr:MMPL family transporter [Actinomycetota bacterium]